MQQAKAWLEQENTDLTPSAQAGQPEAMLEKTQIQKCLNYSPIKPSANYSTHSRTALLDNNQTITNQQKEELNHQFPNIQL